MIASLKSLFLTLVKLAQRWPWLIALFGFVSGAASYFLIERSESLAQVIAIVMLVSYLWLAPAACGNELRHANGASAKSVFCFTVLYRRH